MSIEITINDQLSIADLQQRQAEGFSVLRSAHVGNMQPYNMALAAAGIPLLCVDHTITGIDTNYFPELVICQSKSEVIAPLGRLVCGTVVEAESKSLSQQHLDALFEALPSSTAFTNSQYLQDNRDLTEEVAAIAAANMPQLFSRIARDGITSRQVDTAASLDSLGVLQLNEGTESGVVIPNEVDILINFMVEALQSQKQKQYHLSGPDMVKYIANEQDELDELFELVKSTASFGSQLPKVIQVDLVPTAAAKFATTRKRANALDDLLVTYAFVAQEQQSLHARRKSFFDSDQSQSSSTRAEFLGDVKLQESKLDQILASSTESLPELFVPANTANFVTQYDVIAEDGLHVPEFNMSASMATLNLTYKSLQRVRKRLQLCQT